MAKEDREDVLGPLSVEELEIVLSSPIKHGEDELNAITLRRPTIEDICRTGMLMQVDKDSGNISMDLEVGRRYLVRLSALPPSTINQMTPHDFFVAINHLARFFQ